MSNSEDKFMKALAQRNAQKAEEQSRKNGSGYSAFPEIPWSALHLNTEKVIRLLGGPAIEGREPEDCKSVFLTQILGDDGKSFRCIAPSPKERKDWIIHKISSLVLSYNWDADAVSQDGRKGVKRFKYAMSNPDIFNRVNKNNKVDNQYEKGWKFSEAFVWNIIDREHINWHVENKKTRLLSKKAGAPDQNDKVWFDVGVPSTVYNLMIDDILSMDGNTNWEDYDVVLKKLSESPWYKIYHGIDDSKRISEESKKLVVSGKLSDEERSWERFNLDALFPITSYKKIKSSLGILIQQIDKAFGKNFYEELLELLEIEEQQKSEEKDSTKKNYALRKESSSEEVEADAKPEKVEATKVAEPKTEASAEARPSFAPQVKNTSKMTPEKWAGLIDGTLTGHVYKGVSLMTPEEKALVIDIDMTTGMFEWVPSVAGNLLTGAESGFPSPACVHVDPFDGTVFPKELVEPIPN
ncbi:MAG: hypothetical protein ACRCZB_05255 [Bacteroidales bacterium]